MKDFKPEPTHTVKTFGMLKKGDFIYAIANEPFAAEVEDVVSVVQINYANDLDLAEHYSKEDVKEVYIKCSKLLANAIMILKSSEHRLEISQHMTITSDRKTFQEAIRHSLTPRLMAMKERVKMYEELLAEKIEVVQ